MSKEYSISDATKLLIKAAKGMELFGKETIRDMNVHILFDVSHTQWHEWKNKYKDIAPEPAYRSPKLVLYNKSDLIEFFKNVFIREK